MHKTFFFSFKEEEAGKALVESDHFLLRFKQAARSLDPGR